MRALRGSIGLAALATMVTASVDAGQSVHADARRGAAALQSLPTLSQRIAADPVLSARMLPLLPGGLTVEAAARGFMNEGQFCAAVHVSKNLGVPLAELRAELMGLAHDNLRHAIRKLRPNADARAEAIKAEREAKADLDASAKARSKAETSVDPQSASQ
ncbi:MAG: hypothetical protein WBD07_11180 [Vicinamibacterales bacterium]